MTKMNIMQKDSDTSNKKVWDEIYHGFNNDICLNCRWYTHKINKRKMSDPQPIPYIGPKFGEDNYRLMFVGIETYNNPRFKNWDNIKYNEFGTDRVSELFFRKNKKKDKYSPFWGWVKEISIKVLGMDADEAFQHIAYSNLHKCQSRKYARDFDKSQREKFQALSVNCIQRARWIFHEIKKIDPKNVIIFSGNDKQHFLAKLFLNDYKGKIIKKSKDLRKDRNLLVHLTDGKRRIIVTQHPQGTLNEIRKEIIDIITGKITKKPIYWKMP